MKKPLRLSPLALTAALAALAALLLPWQGRRCSTPWPLWSWPCCWVWLPPWVGTGPTGPAIPSSPGRPPFPRRHEGAEPSPSPKHPCTIRRFFP